MVLAVDGAPLTPFEGTLEAHICSQVALNWVLHRPGVTAPIFGARTPEQLRDNLGSTGWSLGDAEIARLNAASQIPLPSPYNFIARYTRQRT